MVRRWHDGYGDCDVSPGDPACLCCWKLWNADYCQFIPVDVDAIRREVLKTLDKKECERCQMRPPHCGYNPKPDPNRPISGEVPLIEEIESCPCEEASRENCAKCQDLPVWYFDREGDKKE